MKLSVIVPVFNEVSTILLILDKIKAVKIKNVDIETIVVDDFSTDGTRKLLSLIKKPFFRLVMHERNMGKGAALKTGLQHSTGEIIIFQDADLEYDPNDYESLITPILDNRADVVYGSRFLDKKIRLFGSDRVFLPHHFIGNKFLILLMNFLYNVKLSDMETCYTVIKASLMRSLELKSDNFEITPELTAKILKRGIKIHEVSINYSARDHSQGKKISWKDGITAAWILIKYRFVS